MRDIRGNTSQELREQYLEHHLVPLARALFEKEPGVQSLVLSLAQFWADEADDAVHAEFTPCPVENPEWPACLNDNPFVDEWGYAPSGVWNIGDALRLPTLHENSTMITAFASFTQEGSHQEMDLADAFLPYAIARRGDGPTGVVVETVGTMLRPEWEDRFDVGFDAEDPLDEQPVNVAPATSEPEPNGPNGQTSKPSWWRRIFGS